MDSPYHVSSALLLSLLAGGNAYFSLHRFGQLEKEKLNSKKLCGCNTSCSSTSLLVLFTPHLCTQKEERMSSRFEVSEVPADEPASGDNGHSESQTGQSKIL